MIERALPVQQFIGNPEATGGSLIVPAKLAVGPQLIDINSTGDFDLFNGWTTNKRNAISLRRERGDFIGRNGWEAGVGDGRNPLLAGIHVESSERGVRFTGVDLDPWRAVLAQQNLLAAGVPADKLTILVGGVVNDLLARDRDHSNGGWHLACLPQAPANETANHADGIDASHDMLNGAGSLRLGPFSADQVGLSLNAAYLDALRRIVPTIGTDVQVTLSGRIPSVARNELFTQTGWKVQEIFRTAQPIRQDHDTGVAYVADYADYLDPTRGDGFFEDIGGGRFIPITPAVAESRRMSEGPDLRFGHHVYEYLAVPATSANRRDPVTVYEL